MFMRSNFVIGTVIVFFLCLGISFQNGILQPSEQNSYDSASSEVKNLYGGTYLAQNETLLEGIKFVLYTRKNPTQYKELHLDYLHKTHLDPNRPVKILVHGWKCSNSSAVNILIKNAYLIQFNANIIIVDWSKYSKQSYSKARYAVPEVAKAVAKLVDELYAQLKIGAERIHIVGHSLGAHVAGIAGQRTNKTVDRITGLDPAGPFFSVGNDERISKKSAKFVDVIHTSGGVTGFYTNLGHVDFYPNGGTPIQPGCGFDFLTLRSHRRAYWLFAESITTTDGFISTKCDSWKDFKRGNCKNESTTQMGEHVSRSAEGMHFLHTNNRTPFALEAINSTIANFSD